MTGNDLFANIGFAIPSLKEVELDRIARDLSTFGYKGLEPLINDTKGINIKNVKEILDLYDMKISGFRTGLIYFEEGISFSDPDLDLRKRAIRKIKEVIKISSYFGSRVLLGLIQGKLRKGINVSLAKKWIIECIKECAIFAMDLGVKISIEPVNRYELPYNNTINEVKELMEIVGLSKASILIDTFHMNIEEVSICDSIISARNYIGHVHFADSNRLVPGAGHLNFTEIIDTLKQINYNGWITLEINHGTNFEIVARDGMTYLRGLIK